jgi:hypothetical protein
MNRRGDIDDAIDDEIDDEDRPYDQYGGVPPHVSDSSTSAAAAVSMLRGNAALILRERVFSHIAATERAGCTCAEAVRDLGGAHQSISARIKELRNDGRIVIVGERPNPSKRKAWIYVAARFLGGDLEAITPRETALALLKKERAEALARAERAERRAVYWWIRWHEAIGKPRPPAPSDEAEALAQDVERELREKRKGRS